MKSDFQFSNLLGTVYRQGNLLFTEDGTKLISPVGNRVTIFDLIKNRAYTLNYEHRKNISCIALNRQGTLLLSVDDDGRAILVNFVARTVLHHFNFKEKVREVSFSPDGKHFALAAGRFIQIWKTPDVTEDRQFAPFVRHRVYAGHYSDVLSVSWSHDSRFLVSTSKDLTARIFSLHSEDKDVKMILSGHRDYVVKAFFDKTQEIIYTISRDGAIFRWEYTERPDNEDEDEEDENNNNNNKDDYNNKDMNWRIISKNFFFADAKLKCASFHANSNLLIVGFNNGEFRLYELPTFTMVQQLSMGQNAINTINVNSSGEWIAFGSKKLGQLLVYEWQSESYILKQQGHFDSMNSLAYSPDGSRIVTASDDGKIKIWDIVSGFCLATFEEHSSAVTDIAFAKRGQVMFSSSLDGTIKAWDLIRFRNFRTFTSTERIQFSCLAVDPSGEIVCAGSLDDFKIHIWSVQTSQLLDQLSGHEGPVSNLSFGIESTTNTPLLASSSWDKTIRVWNIFNRTQESEPFLLNSECLTIAMRNDSKEVAVSLLDGSIVFFDVESGKQNRLIDCKKDILRGRFLEDRFNVKNSTRGLNFVSISYSFDGLSLIASGNNNSICLYDLQNDVLLKRFIVSRNMTLNGTQEFLNSKQIGANGLPLGLIDDDGESSDLEDRLRVDKQLPGSNRGDLSARVTRPEIRVMSIQFSPNSTSFAAASTEGLLIYSIDDELNFDPFDLDIDITPETIEEVLKEEEYLTAFVMSFRLNEQYLINKIYESIPVEDIGIMVKDLPIIYIEKLMNFIGNKILLNDEGNKHIEFNLQWVEKILSIHGKYILKNKFKFSDSLKLIQRFLNRISKDIVKLSYKNEHYQEFFAFSSGSIAIEDGDDESEIIVDPEDEEEEQEERNDEDEEDNDEDDDDDDDEVGGWFGPGDVKKPNTDKFESNSDDSDDSDEEME